MGEPQSAQKLRHTPWEDENSFGCPRVNRSVALGTRMKVVIGDEVCRRQLSQ